MRRIEEKPEEEWLCLRNLMMNRNWNHRLLLLLVLSDREIQAPPPMGRQKNQALGQCHRLGERSSHATRLNHR